jgi:4-hydroxy-tetrahydrodipicolinate reductase
MSDNIRVIQYGLGPIGSAVARHIVERSGLELVGGVDVDPAKVGRDVGDVIGLGRPLGFNVSSAVTGSGTYRSRCCGAHHQLLLRCSEPDLEILDAGLDVVSTSELSFLAVSSGGCRDRRGRPARRQVCWAEVNPGFSWTRSLRSAISQRVTRIEVTRVINASTRRGRSGPRSARASGGAV